jgi:thioredoxin-dependent peroxiredoxin
MIEERTGEAFELGEQLTVAGSKLKPGDMAPGFELDYFDQANEEMRTVRLSDSAGSVRLLNVINSLDTPVCHVETHRFEDSRSDLPPDVRVYTISMDLPFA